jgi:hypothetical protein
LRRIELKQFNGQWNKRGVVQRIRRKVQRSIAQGECVLLDGEEVVDLELPILRAMVAGLPEDKFRLLGFSALRSFPPPREEDMRKPSI